MGRVCLAFYTSKTPVEKPHERSLDIWAKKCEPKICDPGRHLEECSGARAGKCPTECFLSAFGHLARSTPKSAFWVLFFCKQSPEIKGASQKIWCANRLVAYKRWLLWHTKPDSSSHMSVRSKPTTEFANSVVERADIRLDDIGGGVVLHIWKTDFYTVLVLILYSRIFSLSASGV